jgi:hypothetical protein
VIAGHLVRLVRERLEGGERWLELAEVPFRCAATVFVLAYAGTKRLRDWLSTRRS